jgi:hypothetical protein
MQSSNNDKKLPANQQANLEEDVELNETWRTLLGLQSAAQTEKGDEPGAEEVQPLPADPWSHLINAQGMQAIDLQKIDLHGLLPGAGEDDVEHALELMRESTGKLRALNKPAPQE